jgi:ABC-type nitrate/sulfonate/bicarbonate transport system permease component
MTNILPEFLKKSAGILFSLLLWELVALLAGPTRSVPAPLEVVTTIYAARFEYLPHIVATLRSAVLGLFWGVVIGCFSAVLITVAPALDALLAPCTFVFSIPLIILVPIIGMTSSPDAAPVICSVLLVYYPILVLVNVGLRNVPHTVMSYAKSSGATPASILRNIRIRYALPGLAAGLEAAIPVAILGSMLGELTGARWGLGAYLLAIMVQANPAKEWGIFAVSAVLAGGASGLSAVVWRRLGISATTVSPLSSASVQRLRLLIGLIVSLSLWQLVSSLMSNPFFVKRPSDIVRYLQGYSRPEALAFVSGLGQTLEWAGIGLALGLATGFLLALVLRLWPIFSAPLLTITFVTQAVPIVALVPLYVSIFGRGPGTTLAITVSATFFLSFASVYQGLQRTPEAMVNFALSAGASPLAVLRRIRIPASIPFLFAAVRLTTPRVLLGVTLAEYLATRQGLGAMLFEARGTLDFNLMWAIALCVGGITMLFVELVRYCEHRSLARYT